MKHCFSVNPLLLPFSNKSFKFFFLVLFKSSLFGQLNLLKSFLNFRLLKLRLLLLMIVLLDLKFDPLSQGLVLFFQELYSIPF